MKTSSPSGALPGFLLALLGAMMFSTKAIFVKLAYKHTTVDALSLLALRMLFSLPFFLAAAWWSRRKQVIAPNRRQLLYIACLGIFGYYLSSLFDFWGLQYISAGLERLILFLYPTFAVLINLFIFRQPISLLQKKALILTYAGILLAFFSELNLGKMENGNVLWGSFLVFLCAITFSVYIVGTGKLVQRISSTQFTAYAMLAATTGILLHYVIRSDFSVFPVAPSLWFYGMQLAIFATVVPSFLIANALKRIGSNNVAIIQAIGPVATILQAYLFLGEKITFFQLLGTALVIAGVLVIGRGPKSAI